MWWVLQITACAILTAAALYVRSYGWSLQTYLVLAGANVFFASWMIVKSYEIAPSFLVAWFVGSATLAVCGLVGSVFILHEVVEWYKYVGAVLTATGGVLLVI